MGNREKAIENLRKGRERYIAMGGKLGRPKKIHDPYEIPNEKKKMKMLRDLMKEWLDEHGIELLKKGSKKDPIRAFESAFDRVYAPERTPQMEARIDIAGLSALVHAPSIQIAEWQEPGQIETDVITGEDQDRLFLEEKEDSGGIEINNNE